MKRFLCLLLALATPCLAREKEQEEPPLILPEEREAVAAQTEEFNAALAPILATAAKSTVSLWSGDDRLAYGTVIGDGTKLLSKWSELAEAGNELRIRASGNQFRSVRITGVYQDEDLAVLEIDGSPLTPISWTMEPPKLGSFLATPQPGGRLAAYGVVSVLERNLRTTDKAFLGVGGDIEYKGRGVRVRTLTKGSGATKAGLQVGDIILKVRDREISGTRELQNSLIGLAPGTSVPLLVESAGKTRTVDVPLMNRPKMYEQFHGERLEMMERMGSELSTIRDSFSHAVQTDMRPQPNQIGGPIVDLKGNAIGLTLARADRTRSFYMPAAAIAALLKTEATNPAFAKVRDVEKEQQEQLAALQAESQGPETEGPRARPNLLPKGKPTTITEEQMMRHISDLQRLMEHLQDEVETLENR
jgi:PDZ domain